MRNTNYHTHIYLCKHATGNVEDYVKKAIALNYQELGFSDHGPLSIIQISRRMNKEEYRNIYLKELALAKAKYGDKLSIKTAVEVEYFPSCIPEYLAYLRELDYLVLGQHDIIKGNQVVSLYSSEFKEDDLVIYQDMIIEALKTGLFKILAHPDLFMFRLREYTNLASMVSANIIQACYDNNCYLEFNANGLRKYQKKKDSQIICTYPYPTFWLQVKEFQDTHPDFKVIISDDCHAVEDFHDECTLKAVEILDQLQIKYVDKIIFNDSKKMN